MFCSVRSVCLSHQDNSDVRICPDLVTTDLRMENKGFIIVSKTNVENDDIVVVATGVNFFGKFNIKTMNYVKDSFI